MEEGQERQEDLAPLVEHRHPGDRLVRVGPQVAVGEHGGLGGAGGAAGVQQDGDVVSLGQRGRGRHRGVPGDLAVPGAYGGGQGGGLERGTLPAGPVHGQAQGGAQVRGHGGGQVHGEDRALRRRVAQCGQGLEPLLPGHQDPGLVALQLGSQLLGRGQGVVLGHHRPQAQGPVDGDDVLGAVGHEEGHPVPPAHARLPQQPRGPQAGLPQLGVGQGGAQEVQGHPLGVEGGGRVQQLGERGVGYLDERRDPHLVVGPVVGGRVLPRRGVLWQGAAGGGGHGLPHFLASRRRTSSRTRRRMTLPMALRGSSSRISRRRGSA